MGGVTVCIYVKMGNKRGQHRSKKSMVITKENAKMNEQKIKSIHRSGPENPNQSFQNQPLPELLEDSWSAAAAAAAAGS